MAISQNFPNTRPSLNLNFARSRKLDSRITFTRGSTATCVDDTGLIRTVGINEARFDYDPITGESLGLLIEESRTNLLQYSQALATSPWGIFNGGGFSVSNNVTTSPDGTSNASQINCTSFTNGDSVYQDASVSGTGTYTLSVFVKGGTCNSITLAAFFTGNSIQGFSFNYNPLTGQITGTGGGSNHTVVPYPNGWYRIYFTATGTNVLNNTLRFQVYTNATGITYLWGAQLEQGAFPTSYIPTVASTVTRSADSASITGTNFTDWYNQSEGTLFASSRVQNTSSTDRYIAEIYKDNSNISASLRITSATFYGYTRNSGTFVGDVSSGTNIANSIMKSSYSYKTNDIGLCINGGVIATDTSAAIPTDMTTFLIGGYNSGVGQYCGTIAQISYYPVRLPNTQLITLTK